MLGALKGFAQVISPGLLLVFVSGVGYEVKTTLSDHENLDVTAETLWHIVFCLKQDKIELFGFRNPADKELFNILSNVSGVGGKTALTIINQKHLLGQALSTNEPTILAQIPGIGKKTAEKILLELRDNKKLEIPSTCNQHKISMEAISVLTNLGINKLIATKVVQQALKDAPDISLEILIKQALAFAR